MKPRKFTDALKPDFFKAHDYVSFKVAPSVDNTNEHMDTLIKAFHSVRNDRMFKHFKGGGQPVVALEFYADSKKSFYMYTVPEAQKYLFKEKLNGTFKGAGIKEYQHLMWPFNFCSNDMLVATINLSKPPMFPIRMKDSSIAKDFLGVMEGLQPNERAFVQILLEPLEDGWQSELEGIYEKYLQGESVDSIGSILRTGGKKLDKSISNFGRHFSKEKTDIISRRHREIKEFGTKCRQSAFNVVVRVVVESSTFNRRNDIVEGVASAFKTSADHNTWTLSPVIRKQAAMETIQARRIPLLNANNILCDDEVKGLLNFPTKDVVTNRLERMRPDEESVDQRITRSIIPVGYSIEFDSRGTEIGFSIANPDTASKARLWIAPPGSGKSTAVKLFMQGAIAAGHGGSIFDVADGRLYLESIESTDPRHRGKLVLVDFANTRYPHVFNFSSLGQDADSIGMMFAEFFEIFYKTASYQRMNSFLQKSAITTFTDPDASFLELILLMRDEDFRKKFLPTLKAKDPDLFLWWKSEFPKLMKSDAQANEILGPIIYRLDQMQYNKRIAPIFCGRGGKLDIANWMNQGFWVLYNLSNGVFLETEQRMLMSFLNYAYWSATLSREGMLQAKKDPIIHHKMYDEPQTYMTATPVFELSISKSRKYRVSDNFLIQNPTQVIKKDAALWNQIIGMNPHILVGGGLDNDGLKEMAGILKITKDELAKLENLEYHWYFKTYVGKEALKPFIFNANGMVAKDYGPDPALQQRWQSNLAPKTYEEHRRDISARNLKLSVDEYDKLLESYETPDEGEGVPLGQDSQGTITTH